jgi:hypothetical protein
MATFSVNQVRHLYVAKSSSTNLENPGDIKFTVSPDKKSIWFTVMGPNKDVTRTDIIDFDKILDAKMTEVDDGARSLKQAVVTLSTEAKDSTGSGPIAGQDYILRILFRNYLSSSGNDNYIKYGVVHATANMSTSDFYKKMAMSLAKNFSREETKLLKFMVGGKEITASTKLEDLEDITASEITLIEVDQPYTVGLKSSCGLQFDVMPAELTVDGGEIVWGNVVYSNSGEAAIANGRVYAELEHFTMGDRGDNRRNVGFPYVVPTKYMVDPELNYASINIHYAYIGSNESAQKSEKDITIISPDESIIEQIAKEIDKYYSFLPKTEE